MKTSVDQFCMAKKKQFNYIISACLVGVPCRWNGKGEINQKALRAFLKGKALLVCPEIMTGLTTPRRPCEIAGGDGHDILTKKAKVVDIAGRDYSKKFRAGASACLALCQKHEIKKAILKSDSPSCGTTEIYDGSFTGKKRKGQGVTAALLTKNGIKLF